MTGRTIAHYRILAQLGAGGMGEVYLAEDLKLGRRVALKVPKGEPENQPSLLREARLAARLDHPNICQVYEVGEHDGLTYIAMQYIEGQTLAARLRAGPLAWDEARAIARQAAEGLAEAHRLGVLHRDIKPANIMLGARGPVKVMDFGLAVRDSRPGADQQSSTQSMLSGAGSIAGTLPYMAPEQLRGESADTRSDIYSFGATLYEMLAGQRAFGDAAHADLIAAILTRDPARIPGAPDAAMALLRQCLDKSPGARPASMKDLIARLAEAPAARQASPRRRAIYAGALVAAALAIGALTYRLLPVPEPDIHSLAILSFENRSGDAARDYLGGGLSETIAADLSRVEGLRLIAPSATAPYRGANTAPDAIGRELNVDAVLIGSVANSGASVEITVGMVDAHSGRERWRHTYPIVSGNLFATEQAIARDVASRIHAPLTALGRARLSDSRKVNPQAYDLFLRGRYHADRENAQDVDQAISLYQQAAVLEPAFAPIQAELARAYGIKSFYIAPNDAQLEEQAFAAVEKAFALDPDSPEAHFVRGLLLWRPSHGFAHREALSEYRRAVAIQPNMDEAWHQIGLVLFHTGHLDEGLEAVRKAIAINPSNTLARLRVAVVLLYQGKYQAALDAFHQVPRVFNPSLLDAQTAWTLMDLGRQPEAAARIKEGLAETPRDPGGGLHGANAMLLAKSGDRTGAVREIRAAVEFGRGFGHFHHTAYSIACAYALLGDLEQAEQWIENAAGDGFPCYTLFEKDPNLDRLRASPRFRDFVAKLRRDWEQVP